MTKLRRLRVSAFRGARFNLPLDFTRDHRSIALYGENASGKSTITDALEWFIHDKVEHLWREDCKKDSLRHVLSNDNEPSEVELEFSGKNLSSIKTLSPDLKTTQSNNHPDFNGLIAHLQADHIFLRHAQITEFLNESKGNKRKAIASIIGYDEILKFRDAIQSTFNALRRDTGYLTAKNLTDTHKNTFLELVGEILTDTPSLYKKANEILQPFQFPHTITDEKTYDEAITALQQNLTDPEKAKKRVRLEDFAMNCTSLKTQLDSLLTSLENFATSYNDFARDKSSVGKIRITDFLTKGTEVIEKGYFADPNCPFCLTDYDLQQLQTEVQERIAAIAELKTKFDAIKTSKENLQSALNTTKTLANNIATQNTDLVQFKTFTANVSSAASSLTAIIQDLNTRFGALDAFNVNEATSKTLNSLSGAAQTTAGLAKAEANKLTLTEKETKTLEAIRKLDDLRKTFGEFSHSNKLTQLYEEQILTLSAIFESFKTTQNEALQAVLDSISEDVGAFYKKLHPKENVDKVRLCMVGEEGVEFEYYFHGKSTQPPRKYLSESHLNSLGIVLFLANAKLFNNQSKILVLDDIVTSFDTGHRRRLLRLLKEEFSDWQIILLTHETLWFDLIKAELAQSGWLFKELTYDDDNGIRLEESAQSLRLLIDKKRATHDVSNDIRKLLEALLKEICFALEVKLPFRFNDLNEKRMSAELLNGLRATLNRKSEALAQNMIFSDLQGSSLIATVGSHDNKENIVGADIDVALEDIDKLAGLFVCDKCNKYVEAQRPMPGRKKISCPCGHKELDWKA